MSLFRPLSHSSLEPGTCSTSRSTLRSLVVPARSSSARSPPCGVSPSYILLTGTCSHRMTARLPWINSGCRDHRGRARNRTRRRVQREQVGNRAALPACSGEDGPSHDRGSRRPSQWRPEDGWVEHDRVGCRHYPCEQASGMYPCKGRGQNSASHHFAFQRTFANLQR